MKLIAAALLAALTGCVSTPPIQPCDKAIQDLETDQTIHGRKLLGLAQPAPGVMIGVFQAPSDDTKYALLFSSPGALVPPEGTPFEFVGLCTTPQGNGRLYRAKLVAMPKI